MAAQLEITALFTYPVKSCRAIPHREIALDDWGMSWDRRWMVVDAEGQFLTQRTYPRMAQIDVAISAEALSIHAPGQPVLRVPLDAERSPLTQVVVWRDATEAWDEGDAAADWFSRFLGDSVRMVRMPDDFVRPVNPKYATKPSRVSFADAYPVLVASEESLADLNRRLGERGARPVTMDRFRPNFVVRGAEAWAEDGWRQLRCGDLLLDVVKPCTRCPITTTDQSTGEIPEPGEPLATLATFRRWEGSVIFAQNVIHRSPGILKVGDVLEVVV
jgi:uncharacterized protein YcbX